MWGKINLFYLLLCNKLPQTYQLNIYLIVSLAMGSRHSFSGSCGSGSLKRLKSRCQSKLSLIWRLDGEGSTSKLIHIVVAKFQFLQGCWVEGFVSLQEFNTSKYTSWEGNRESLLAKWKSVFYNTINNGVPLLLLYSIIRSKSLCLYYTQEVGIIQGLEYQEVGIIGSHFLNVPTTIHI